VAVAGYSYCVAETVDEVGAIMAAAETNREEPRMKATYQPRSGFSNYQIEPRPVTILGFVEATIEPGYQSHGIKRCIVAVISDEHGKLSTAELSALTMQSI